MIVGGWRPDAVAAARSVDEMCDSIDMAYQAHEFPLVVVSNAAPEPEPELEWWKDLIHLTKGAIILPPGFKVEFIGPSVPQHPWELARWADDGGRV